MTSKYVAHIVAGETDPGKSEAQLLFHQETKVDGTTETTNAAVWTYQNFLQAALYNSTLNVTEATFKLHVEAEGVSVDITLYDDSNATEEEPPAPIKVV